MSADHYDVVIKLKRSRQDDEEYVNEIRREKKLSRRDAIKEQILQELQELDYLVDMNGIELAEHCQVIDILFEGETMSYEVSLESYQGTWWIWDTEAYQFIPHTEEMRALKHYQRFCVFVDDLGVPQLHVHLKQAYPGLLIRMSEVLSREYGVIDFIAEPLPGIHEHCKGNMGRYHEFGVADAEIKDGNVDADVEDLDEFHIEVMAECEHCEQRGYVTLRRKDFNWES